MAALGWIDDDAEWRPLPPPPEWDPAPIQGGEWIRAWNGTRLKRRKAVPDPMPLFRYIQESNVRR